MQYSSTITMSHKEMNYMRMCIRIFEGTLSMRQGAEELGVSYRTIQRKMSRFRTHGQEGIVHKLRNAPPNRHIDYEVKTQVLSLLSTTYKGYSASYASELLADEHHIIISPSSIRRWLTPHTTIKKKKRTVYRSRRPRMNRFGTLLQGDGSFHCWFGPEYPPCCLLVLVDDATNRMICRFAEQEYAKDMLILLRQWIDSFGIPDTLYFDKRNAYVKSPTRVRYIPRVCDDLGIAIINAHSPQAKGRVERVNRTLQDRLVKDLIRHGITSIEQANEFLVSYFLPRYNTRFSIAPKDPADAHVPIEPQYLSKLDTILAKHYYRTVNKDWTFSVEATTYQITSQSHSLIKPRQKILGIRYLDDSFVVYSNGQEIFVKEV